jgi:hypothetical protein
MHFNFGFTTVQVIWTLSFAAMLVLLVVLLGRDRAGRFPWFTTGIVLIALRLLAARMLFGRMAQIPLSAIFITLADLGVIVGLLVLVELARKAFGDAKRRSWIISTMVVLTVGAVVLATWGAWPAWKTFASLSAVSALRLLQLIAQKGDLLLNVLTVELGLLIVLFGRRFKAGWRSHTQQIMIGLSTVAIGELVVQGVWQVIALTAAPQSRAEYERILGLREHLFNANSAAYVPVLLWWIVCLWIDEPGTAPKVAAPPEQIPAEAPSEGAPPASTQDAEVTEHEEVGEITEPEKEP